jgi:hypothetical protein
MLIISANARTNMGRSDRFAPKSRATTQTGSRLNIIQRAAVSKKEARNFHERPNIVLGNEQDLRNS